MISRRALKPSLAWPFAELVVHRKSSGPTTRLRPAVAPPAARGPPPLWARAPAAAEVEPALAALLRAGEAEYDVEAQAATLAGAVRALLRVGDQDPSARGEPVQALFHLLRCPKLPKACYFAMLSLGFSGSPDAPPRRGWITSFAIAKTLAEAVERPVTVSGVRWLRNCS